MWRSRRWRRRNLAEEVAGGRGDEKPRSTSGMRVYFGAIYVRRVSMKVGGSPLRGSCFEAGMAVFAVMPPYGSWAARIKKLITLVVLRYGEEDAGG